VVITDEQGKFIGRNLDARADAGRDLRAEFDAVAAALQSRQPVHDYLRYDGQKWFDVVSAPIVRDGQAVGLLMVGYEIADSQAEEDKRRLGAEVGYLVREGDRFALQSLSFGTQTEKNAIIAWANAASLAATFNSGGTQQAQTISISGHDWTIAARALPGLHNPTRQGAVRAGYIVLRDVTAERSPSTGMVLPILYLSLIALVFLVVFNVLVTNSILQPIEQIEEGLLKIINGDQRHRIELRHRELGGVVDRINQLVATLTGEEESDESGRISRAPQRPDAPQSPSSRSEE
jgi:methyl-accepting chemotaxis protein